METVNYKKAGTYYLIGNIFNQGMSFITVPIFSRILSTSDYGVVTTYNSWIAILSMIIGFALHMGIRAAFVDYKNEIDDFMATTTTFTIQSGFILSLIVVLCALFIKINITITLLILCLLQGIASALTQNYSMYLMMKFRYKFRTVLMILPNIISILLSIIAILFVLKSDKLYIGRIVPTACVSIFLGLFVCFLVYKKSRKINIKYLKYGLAISLPLVLHGIALNILSQSDRTMITWLADYSQTGIYGLVYNFSMLATVLTTALDGIWVPWFTKNYQEKKVHEINILAQDYVKLMTCAMVALILGGAEIVKLMASEKYWEGIIIIPPVVLASFVIFLYTLYVNIEHYHKKTVYITINTVIAALTNIVLNYLLIPKYGYVAAAYTTLISYLIAFILHSYYSKKLDKNIFPFTMFIRPLLHILGSVVAFYLLLDKPIIRWLIMLLYLGIMIAINKDKIIAIIFKNNNRAEM